MSVDHTFNKLAEQLLGTLGDNINPAADVRADKDAAQRETGGDRPRADDASLLGKIRYEESTLALRGKHRCRRWTIQEAIAFVREIYKSVRYDCGYVVSIYGSVSRDGGGRDLDLAFNPWGPTAMPAMDAARVIAAVTGGRVGQVVHNCNYLIPGLTSVWLELADGHGVDCAFYDQRPERLDGTLARYNRERELYGRWNPEPPGPKP